LPDARGNVTFGAVFVAQPFSNQLVAITLSGRQLLDALEQQLDNPSWVRILSPSAGFGFAYDMTKPIGERIVRATLDSAAIDPARTYRVAMSGYLADGGDKFEAFTRGTDRALGPIELDALIAHLGQGMLPLPALDRVENKTPR
jgi:5'-nucleotidase